MQNLLKVGDIVRDKAEGDEWEVTGITYSGFEAICIKGSEHWQIGEIEDWSFEHFDSVFEIIEENPQMVRVKNLLAGIDKFDCETKCSGSLEVAIESAISLLKQHGYKIFKPKIEFEEI